jgi:hypothetical protein
VLIVEDGTGVPGANSFETRADLIDYAAARGVVLADDATTDAKAIIAMDYLAMQCYNGDTAFVNQVLPFPRRGIVEGDDAEGYVFSIPIAIRRAQSQLVVDLANGIKITPSRPAASEQPILKRRKVGPIEREFFQPGANDMPFLPIVAGALEPFLCGYYKPGSFKLRTYRV